MNSKRKAVQDKIFKIMSQLDPSGKNKKVYDILVKAGKDIYNTLD